MNEQLELPVNQNGEELLFPMEMIPWGYTHRFKVTVQDTEYLFEPDEEGKYRVITGDQSSASLHDMTLLMAIGDTLQELMGRGGSGT